jgi:hypothetical protein
LQPVELGDQYEETVGLRSHASRKRGDLFAQRGEDVRIDGLRHVARHAGGFGEDHGELRSVGVAVRRAVRVVRGATGVWLT